MNFRLEMESKALERERQENEYKLHQQELVNKQKVDELQHKSSEKTSEPHTSTPKFPKIPPFEDGKDDMDSYLRRFERYAGVQKWPKPTWATHLSALLKGRALDVYALLPSEYALDYDFLKDALLKRYDLTEDGFKRKFRSCKPDIGETFFTICRSS